VTELGLRRSMGCIGSCLDNAVAESFFATLKVELVDRQHYRTCAEARAWILRCGGRARNRSSAEGLGIAGGGRTVTDPSAVRPPTLEMASAGRKPKRAGGLVGAGCHARGFNGYSGELIPNCWCWTKWCTDAVEMAEGFGVRAEHGGLAVGEAVLLAERPD